MRGINLVRPNHLLLVSKQMISMTFMQAGQVVKGSFNGTKK